MSKELPPSPSPRGEKLTPHERMQQMPRAELVLYDTPLPDYFVGTKGVETLAEVRQFVGDLITHPELLGLRNDFPPVLQRAEKYFQGSAEARAFERLIQSGEIDQAAFFTSEPDFKRYYWAPEDRQEMITLALCFLSKQHCLAVRTIGIRANGEVGGVSDFGATDSHRAMGIPDYRKYSDMRASLGQHITDIPSALERTFSDEEV